MIKTTEEIYCDLCNKKIKHTDMSIIVTYHEQDFSGSYVGGHTEKYSDICYECRKKIEKLIENLQQGEIL